MVQRILVRNRYHLNRLVLQRYTRQFFENRYDNFITTRYWWKCCGKIWVYKGFMLLFVNSCQIDSTKIAIVGMVFWFPPNHWNAKLQSFLRTLSPLPQMFNTSFTDYMFVHVCTCLSRPMVCLDHQFICQNRHDKLFEYTLLHHFFHWLFWTRQKYNKMNHDGFYKM